MSKEPEKVDLANRLALRPKEAAHVLGVSERMFRTMLPQLPHVREGGVVLVPVDGLREWLQDRAKEEQCRTEEATEEVLRSLGRFEDD